MGYWLRGDLSLLGQHVMSGGRLVPDAVGVLENVEIGH